MRKRNSWNRDGAMVRSFRFSGSRFRCRCRYILVEKLLTLFLSALGVQDHLFVELGLDEPIQQVVV